MLRERFPILARRTYLNSCSQGALSTDVRDAYAQYLRDWDEHGSPWELWVAKADEARAAFAALVGARQEDVALTASLSAAVNAVASGLRFEGERRSVVLSEVEFPTVGQIWHAQEARGARVIHAADVVSAIDDTTLLVSITHVSYRTGERLPVEEIVRAAREHGALVLLDAYQSAGTLPLDVGALGVDFLAAGTVKYLLGSAGLAFLFARPEAAAAVRPTVTGWFADEDVFAMDDRDYSPAARAARFQAGTPPVPNAYAAVAGLALVAEAVPERTADHVAALGQRLEEGVASLGGRVLSPALRGALVAVESTEPAALVDALAAEGVVVSWRDRGVRFSPHFYNDESDVDAALAALERHRALLAVPG